MIICPNCGTENPERAKFCLECGGALAPSGRAQEERKVVSVLFIDLVGFTARSHEADPEDVRAALGRYYSLLRGQIERFGGTVEKFIGDAVMAVFGAPIAHEDDAERAVRAALRIVEAIEELNEQQPALDLAIRGAVNTGEAVVVLNPGPESGEGLVTGDVVNTASRLQGEAPAGGVLVGEVTYRSTSSFIDYEDLHPVRVKGKPHPIKVWRAIAARSRYGIDVDISPTTPFVGREVELELLESSFRRTLHQSSVQLVTILGEPGVGKTRLLTEFASHLDEQELLVYWRQGRSLPYGEGITFWALGEIVKAHAGILDSDGPDQAAGKLGSVLAHIVDEQAERDWLAARLSPLIGTSGRSETEVRRDETFAAWRRFLEAVGRQRPLVVVFEDLHWADPAMLEFIDHLVEWSTGAPMLVLCSARPELFEKYAEWGGGKPNSTTISLSPLSESDTARLIGDLLSSSLLPAELQTTLLQRAGGNPLYASEFVRMLKDRGLLSNDGRSLTISADDIPVPESIHSCIAARLDTLAPDRKSLLQDAAVVGKVFWNGALAHIGSTAVEAIKDSLHELVRKELIRPSFKSSLQGQEEYSFRHALIRDVSYGQIPKSARGRKHHACAQWIESVAEERVGDQAEVLAHHYEHATRLRGGSDTESRALGDKTRRYLLLAGDRALQLDAGRARRFYERALEFAPADDPAHAGVVASLARAAHLTGDLTAAASLYDRAIPALLENGQPLRAGELLVWFSFLEWYRGLPQAELANIERAIDVLEAEPPGAELAQAYATMAGREVVVGHPRSGLSWAEKSLELAERLGAHQVRMEALGFVGVARVAAGEAAGIHDLRRAVALGLELGLGHATALAYTNLLYITRLLEGPSAAKLVADEALTFVRRRGLYEQEMFIQSNVAENLYEAGDWDEALTVTDEILDWARSHRVVQMEVQALATKILVLAHRGDIREASSLAPTYLSGAHRVSDPQVLLPALVGVALVRQANGEPLEAMKLLAEGERLLRGNPEIAAWQLPDAMRLCIAARKPERGTRLLQSVEVQGPHQVLPVRTAEAILWEATGRLVEAIELYAEVALAWNRRGSKVEEALAVLGQGRCWLALGRGDDARSRLEEARELLLPPAARPWIEEVNELLGRATALSS